MKRILLVGFVLLAVASVWAQNVTLLKDINTATNASSSSPSNIIKNAAGTIFFTATDLERGNELWKTNGTDAGTVVIKDINPGSGSSSPANFVVIGNEVYFSANDGINGVELWRSDGTAAGTYMLEDINVGPNSSSPVELEVSGTTIYFSASTDAHGRELWKSGTGINTAQEILDIEIGTGNSSPSQITNANGVIYFTAFRTAEGRELWRYTGALPIGPIEDITSGSSSTSISGITAVNPASSTTIVFSASTSANGTELWRSSGTASGTYVIDIANLVLHISFPPIDIEDYDNSSSPSDFVSKSGVVYFAATDYDGERGLYSTSGASSSDYDRLDALGDLNPEDMVVCSTGVVFFSGTDSGGDRELYKLSGGSVSLVENISSTGSSTPQNLIVPESGSFVYFSATSSSFGRELYTSTTSDATRISDISSGADDSTPVSLLYHAGVYMSGFHGTTGRELYFYNGSTTSLVKDINGGTEDSNPTTFLNTGSKLFFQAVDAGGQELWASDGTSGNTLRIADITAGASGSFAFPIAMAGSTLLFSANDGTNGTELYTSTGVVGNFTLHNTNAAAGSFSPSSTSATLGGFVYFAGEATTSIGRELYRSNGGAPTLVSNINSAADADSNPSNFLSTEGTTMSATNLAFFTATTTADGTELYRVTSAGSVSLVADININPGTSSSPSSLTILGSHLYFACSDGSIGSEIYRTNGNINDKLAVTNINPGIADAFPSSLTAVNSKLVFRATDGTTGFEPWVLDPVTLVSTRLKDINASGDSSPSNFTLVGSTVYFTANNPGVSGVELYKTDGTVAGTVLVKDIFPGATSSSPSNLKNVNGTLYFRASNADGIFLMKSNGSAAGTIVATSAGVTYQEPANINHLSTPTSTVNNVYFTAKTNTKGNEILFVKAEPPVQPTGLNLTRAASSISGTFTGSSTGTPSGYLVIRNAVSAPDGLPVDGPTAYVAGNTLNGTGVVVQQSASLSFNDNSLTANTTYFYKVFAYYHDGVSYIYQPNSPLAGSATTFSAEPTVQTAGAGVGSITQTSITLSWSAAVAGNGTERIVLAQATTAVTGTPSDGTTYTASSNFTSVGSSTIGGAKVVYKGSGATVTVTNLSPAITYHFQVYELNGTGTQTNYLITQPAGSFANGTTLAINNNQPTNLSFPGINPTSLTLAWDAAAAGLAEGYLVTFKLGSDPGVDPPVNGVQYTAGNAIGASGTFVGFVDGTEALTGPVSGLTPASVYFFRVYAYTGTDVSPAYVLTGPLAGVQATLDTEPANGPTALTLHTPTSTSLSGTITAGAGSPAASAYLVLEKTGSAVSPDAPVDGTSYVIGATIGGSRVVHVGVGLSFTSNALAPNTTYHYAAFASRGSGVAANYKATPATSSRTTLVEDPIDQPADFVFENPTSTTVDVSFTPAPTEPGGGYIVVRREAIAVSPPNVPLDGSEYTVGSSLGASTVVVYVGTGTSFSDAGMNPNTTYHYAAASFNGSGAATNYLHASVPTGSFTTLTAQPASQPTNLVFSNRTNTSVDVSFTAAAGSPSGYVVLRISAPTLAEPPVDGVEYTAGELHGVDVVAFVGSTTTFTDNDLVEGTQYHYAVFAFNGTTGTYNYLSTSPLEGSVFTLAEAPTDQPTNLAFSNPTINSLHLDFDDAANIPAGYVVLRKADSAPSEVPVDGTTYTAGLSLGSSTVAFVGTATEFTDTGLTSNKIYHYTIFSFNGAGTYTTYLTTSPLGGSRTTLVAEPAAQPTALTFNNITSTSASMSFTPSAATQYLVLRKAGNVVPTEVPADGTAYADGAGLITSTVFTVTPAGLPVNESTLSPASEYSYAIFAYSGAAGSTNYLTTAPLTGTVTTLAVAPTAPATALTFTSVATESVTVSWTAPAVAPAGYLVVRKAGSAPTGVPANRTSYTAGSNLGDGIVAYVGVQLNFIDTGLIGETDYYYQVFVFNGNGTTTAYLTASPASGHQLLFAWEPLHQPTNLTFTNILPTGFTVTFTPDPDDFASGHLVLRKVGAAPTASPVDGTTYIVGASLGDAVVAYVGSAATFNESVTLAPYNYAVFAYNGDIGAATNYNQVSPLSGVLTVDSTPPTFTNNNTPTTIGTGLPLKISYKVADLESGLAGSVTLEFKALTSSAGFTSRTMTLVSGNYEADITAAEIGELGLIYRLKATNSNGTAGTSDIFKCLVSFSSLSMPEIPAGSEETDYRIISIPLVLANNHGDKVFEILGESEDGKNWRLYQFQNGGTKNTEVTNLATLAVEPGKGYWLISKTARTINAGGGVVVDVTDTSPFTINLVSGWNLIGNPYLFKLSWTDVNTANSTQLQLKKYHGGFNFGTTLDQFEGAFVSAGGSIALKIPTTAKSTSREGAPKPKLNSIDSEDWEVIISLRSDDRSNPFGGVGMSRDANTGFDYFDDFTLPRMFSYLELNHNKRVYGMTYTKDILPLAESQTWEFSVDASLRGLTEMTWDNSYFGNNDLQLVLWDEEEQMAVDMRKSNSYGFNQGVSRKFRIFFGTQAYIDDKIEANSLRIHSIYPNPSSSDVKVAFSLPGNESSHVLVRVVNGLGQHMVNIFEGELEAGYHELPWSGREANGERPAEGVYVVEVISGELRESKRLVIK